MEFRLLGPIEVADHDRQLVLGGTKQRSLLALLLLNAGEVLSTDRLIAELWGESPPATVAKSVQVYVSRLRRELGADRLVTRAPGYALRLQAHDGLDLATFERLRAEARHARPEVAAGKLREGLALWRGPPLADLTYEPFAQAEIACLEELRSAALEERIDADLAAGRHLELVGELQALTARQPHRERLWAQLMLALYRAGRQADALHAYQAARRELAEELGLRPGEELRRLERAILDHDPGLDLPAPAPARPAPRPAPAPQGSLLVVPDDLATLEPLLSLAASLAASVPARELILAQVVAPSQLAPANAKLAAHAAELRAGGAPVSTAAFSSPTPGGDIVRLAVRHEVELLIIDADSPLQGETAVVLEQAPCDVAVLVRAGGAMCDGPVIVPFGAARHDWAALQLGAAVAGATGRPMRLIGAASDHRDHGRDASHLLADASLILQRSTGVVAEPLLARPGRTGVMALAEGAGLLVVGFPERWREDGLGPVRSALVDSPPAPTVLVLRGPRPGGIAPAQPRTRLSWSMTVGGP